MNCANAVIHGYVPHCTHASHVSHTCCLLLTVIIHQTTFAVLCNKNVRSFLSAEACMSMQTLLKTQHMSLYLRQRRSFRHILS